MNRERFEELLELESASALDDAAARELDAACAASPDLMRARRNERRMVAMLRSVPASRPPRDLAAGIMHRLELEADPAPARAMPPGRRPAREGLGPGALISRLLGFETMRWAAAFGVLVASAIVIRNNLNPAPVTSPVTASAAPSLSPPDSSGAPVEIASAAPVMTAAPNFTKSVSHREVFDLGPDPEADPHRELLIAMVSSGGRTPSPAFHDGPVMRTLDGMTAEEIAPRKVSPRGSGNDARTAPGASAPEAPTSSEPKSSAPGGASRSATVLASAPEPPAPRTPATGASASATSPSATSPERRNGLSNMERIREELTHEANGGARTAPAGTEPDSDNKFQQRLREFRRELAGSARDGRDLTPEDSARIERIFGDLDAWIGDVERRRAGESEVAMTTGGVTAGDMPTSTSPAVTNGHTGAERVRTGTTALSGSNGAAAPSAAPGLRRRAETEIARHGGVITPPQPGVETGAARPATEVIRARISGGAWPALRAGLLGLGIQPVDPPGAAPVRTTNATGAFYAVKSAPGPSGEPSVIEIEITVPASAR